MSIINNILNLTLLYYSFVKKKFRINIFSVHTYLNNFYEILSIKMLIKYIFKNNYVLNNLQYKESLFYLMYEVLKYANLFYLKIQTYL